LPVRAADFDVTVCGTYKWLCAPRGTAFLTIAEDYQDQVSAINAGWYAGESVWDSVYGPDMKLAPDARRFDTSPAWMAWVGTAVALQLFASADPFTLLTHGTTLADALRAGLQLPPAGSAIVSLPDLDGDVRSRLLDAGCTVAGRAGMVRLAFHVWNDESDVERALNVLRS
jgi:selenocysteine lyase/cysteine desulfurase